MTRSQAAVRGVLISVVVLAFIPGLLSGLARLGFHLPLLAHVTLSHGALMAACFLGALVGAERAAALGLAWPWLSPLLALAGALTVLSGASVTVSGALLLVSSLVLLTTCLHVLRRVPTLYLVVMTMGAGLLVAANALLMRGEPISRIAPWWAGFIALTIVGERLERARFTRRPAWADGALFGLAVLLVLGLATSTVMDVGLRAFGATLLAMAIWLLAFDIARTTLGASGLPRYIATCLVSGFAWLGVAGAAWAIHGATQAGLMHDMILHSFFLGFVLPMVFGHAPVVVPAMTGLKLSHTRATWIPLVLLHVSLVVRIAGDLLGIAALREWGGMGNVLAILAFPAALLVSRVTNGAPRTASA